MSACGACGETDCWCTYCGAPCSEECDLEYEHPRVAKREEDPVYIATSLSTLRRERAVSK